MTHSKENDCTKDNCIDCRNPYEPCPCWCHKEPRRSILSKENCCDDECRKILEDGGKCRHGWLSTSNDSLPPSSLKECDCHLHERQVCDICQGSTPTTEQPSLEDFVKPDGFQQADKTLKYGELGPFTAPTEKEVSWEEQVRGSMRTAGLVGTTTKRLIEHEDSLIAFIHSLITSEREKEREKILAALPKYDELIAAAEGAMDDETRLLKMKALIQRELLKEIRSLLKKTDA